ncbi:MAG TPA: histidine kinase dimerization/phospho-acceptor domain-containing protein, partial [Candidatus Dormibacteraeota bacterium]
MSRRLDRVRTASMRVALISTAITAVAFAVIAVVVVLYVNQTLTSQVDTRLMSALNSVESGQIHSLPLGGLRDPAGPRFGPRLLVWIQEPSGLVEATDPTANLPTSFQSITSARSVAIQGTEVRIAGSAVSGGYVVVGQTMDSVSQARSTIVVAELIVGAALLVVIFFGALAVGRRVGAPIELARQRQMEFTADASHELRTPLSVIEAQTSLALAQDRDPAWYQQAFQRIGGESQRIRRLVEDLLWLARVDAPGSEAHPEPVDVGLLATQAVDRFTSV